MSLFARTISFIITGLLILKSGECSGFDDVDHAEWWETTLVYQIMPRSYQDSDGDGVGDLQGIINRLDYIADLGVETICLNPISPSPLLDSGYDVTDYEDVHPMFGNLSDFEQLVEQAHARDIKIILDVVPNHTSAEHQWFESSIHMIDPYTNYYVWANGPVTEDGTMLPPNNWISICDDEENSAWTYHYERDQWYYHKFHELEPDLNLVNPDVRDEILLILEFWLEKGVDGFRITGIPYFYEDPNFGNEPSPSDQIYTLFDKPRNVEFLYDIRKFVDDWTKSNNSTSKYLVSGSYDTDENLLSYYGTDNATGIVPLNYCFMTNVAIAGSNASEVEVQIVEWLNAIPLNASTNWMISNHNNWRIASRVGPDRLDALHMLSMLLPGQAFTYYGDEIGMLDTPIPPNVTEYLKADTRKSDDPDDDYRYSVRSPMQWDDSTSAGFSTSATTYIPVNENYVENNVAEQLENSRSHLNVYEKLAELRKNPVFVRGAWELDTLNNDDILVLRRTLTDHPVYVVVINMANIGQTVNMTELYPDLSEYLEIVVTSGIDDTKRMAVPRSHFRLLPDAGLVLKSGEIDAWRSMEEPEVETEENYDDEEINEMENTTVYVETTTVRIVAATTETYDNSETTINDFTTELPLSTTTKIPTPENIVPKSVDDSFHSSSDAILVNLKLAIGIIFGNMILARAW